MTGTPIYDQLRDPQGGLWAKALRWGDVIRAFPPRLIMSLPTPVELERILSSPTRDRLIPIPEDLA